MTVFTRDSSCASLTFGTDNMLNIKAASLVLLAAAAPVVLGHGQVHSVIIASPSATFPAADAYAAADPTSPLRKLNTYGPAANFTGPDITCGVSTRCRSSTTSSLLRRMLFVARREYPHHAIGSCRCWKFGHI